MKIAYITKTPWGENSPGFVFSYFQSKGFAENGLKTSLLMKVAKSKLDDQKHIDKNLIKNHKIKLFKDNLMLTAKTILVLFKLFNYLLYIFLLLSIYFLVF